MSEDAKGARTQILIAIIGLVGVLGGVLFANWEKIFPPHSQNTASGSEKSSPAPKRTGSQNEKQSEQPAQAPAKVDASAHQSEPAAHTMLNHGTFRIQLREGVKLLSYDFDHSQELAECGGDADFFFKPEQANNPDTRIGVMPCAKAMYAPTSLNRRAWDVPTNEFISAKPTSVAQGEFVPCRTGLGNYCQFIFKRASDADVVLTFTVFSVK